MERRLFPASVKEMFFINNAAGSCQRKIIGDIDYLIRIVLLQIN